MSGLRSHWSLADNHSRSAGDTTGRVAAGYRGRVHLVELPAVAGIALIMPMITFGLKMLALRRMAHTAFGMLLPIDLACGVLNGLVALTQTPTLAQLVGVAIVAMAGATAWRGDRRNPEQPVNTGLPTSTP